MTETLTTALEKRAAAPQEKTVLDLLQRQKPEIEKALPIGVEIDRFERIVRTELRRTPKLLDCDPYSLLAAVMWSAQLGLEPGPLGHVYLVPFKHEVTFIIGYKGMIDLAYRSGHLKDIAAVTVHAGDAFSFRYGTRPVLDHTPAGPSEGREPIAYYAVARTRSGGAPFKVLYPEDVEKAKAQSPGARSEHSPWNTHYDAMARKTAVRRLAPMLPQSPLFAQAVERDEEPAPPVLDVGEELSIAPEPGPNASEEEPSQEWLDAQHDPAHRLYGLSWDEAATSGSEGEADDAP